MVVRWQAGVEYVQYLPWAGTTSGPRMRDRHDIGELIYVTVFSGLRAFALSGQNWFLAGFVLLLSLVPLGINFVCLHLASPRCLR